MARATEAEKFYELAHKRGHHLMAHKGARSVPLIENGVKLTKKHPMMAHRIDDREANEAAMAVRRSMRHEKSAKSTEILLAQQEILAEFQAGGIVDLFMGVARQTPGAVVTISDPLGNPEALMTVGIIYPTQIGISKGEGRIFAFDNGNGIFSLARGEDGIYAKAFKDPDTCDFFEGVYGDELSLALARHIIAREMNGMSGGFNGGDKILSRVRFGGRYQNVAQYREIIPFPKTA